MSIYLNVWKGTTAQLMRRDYPTMTALSETYTAHERGRLWSNGDEIFDGFVKHGMLWVMTDMNDVEVWPCDGECHYSRIEVVTVGYHARPKSASPIRFDLAVSPAHMKAMRYINAKGVETPFKTDKIGMLISMAMATSVFEIPLATAEILRGYTNMPRVAAA